MLPAGVRALEATVLAERDFGAADGAGRRDWAAATVLDTAAA
jgi:hypothetical protein